MKKYLTKKFVSLIVVLMVTSFFGALTTPVANQTVTAQENTMPPPSSVAQAKAMDIIKNVMSVDLSKYSLELIIDSTVDGVPLANDNRKMTRLVYELTPLDSTDENGVVRINFTIEKEDVVRTYFISAVSPSVITTTQYATKHEVVEDFLGKYQTHTGIDSNSLIKTLNSVDLMTSATIIQENIKLVVSAHPSYRESATLRWTYTVNDADYAVLDIIVVGGVVRNVHDTRGLYTIGATTISISKEQAIDMAIENLKTYSYNLYGGEVVTGFEVSRGNVVATLGTYPVDYVLQPYWDIRMLLDKVYPGNVHGITVFMRADTGEIISYSNMAFGGTIANDDINPSSSAVRAPNYTLMAVIAGVMVGVVVVATIGLMTKKPKYSRSAVCPKTAQN